MYRAKQRGLLELDLLIGIYAERNVPTMSLEKLDETKRLLQEENVDLWQWLTQQEEAPDHVRQNAVFQVRFELELWTPVTGLPRLNLICPRVDQFMR